MSFFDHNFDNPCRSAGVMGEYRTVMNLCRVLPDGLECKTAVDEAIDFCNDIGASLTQRLTHKSEHKSEPTSQFASPEAREHGS